MVVSQFYQCVCLVELSDGDYSSMVLGSLDAASLEEGFEGKRTGFGSERIEAIRQVVELY